MHNKTLYTSENSAGITARLTLNMTDLWPLLLLFQGVLKLGTKGDMVSVVKHDADHLRWQMLEPGYRYHLTELEEDKDSQSLEWCVTPQAPLWNSFISFQHIWTFFTLTVFVSPPCLLLWMSSKERSHGNCRHRDSQSNASHHIHG